MYTQFQPNSSRKPNIRMTLRMGGLIVLVLSLVLAGCNVLTPAKGTPDPNLIATLVQQTLTAQQNGTASQTPSVDLPTALPPVPNTPTTVPPTATPLPTNTQVPPTATATPLPTATPVPPTPTATPIPCGWAQYVKDVTVKDGTTFSADTHFTKTWRLKNIGSCTWNSSYDLVFVDGSQMGAATSVALTGNVPPGSTVDLSVNMIAPSKTGTYTGYWQLRDGSGNLFGIGKDTESSFWVKITVALSTIAYDFTANMCSASWANGSASLPCPGTVGSPNGSVTKVDQPALESGMDDEPALRVEPQVVNDGVVVGTYPGIDIKEGDHFRAVVGCWQGMTKCNVVFKLNYKIGNGAVKNLGTWGEAYDKQVSKVDVDLSSLAGQKVTFILSVAANGVPDQDSAFWLLPRILR